MPPRHQRYAGGRLTGGGHVGHSATAGSIAPTGPFFGPPRAKLRPQFQPTLRATPGTRFGIYVHVPFCATRCGYCDFNTYTPSELGGANPDGWLAALRVELELAAGRLGGSPQGANGVGGGG